MLKSALRLAQSGVRVFPVSQDKAPRTPRGFHDATTDPDVIRGWDWTDAMIGSPPNEGTLVIDVDPRNGGEMTLGLFPALPRTRTTKTRSGGRHYWLTVLPDLKLRGTLGPGVDVKRAEKGYVVIPPSPGYSYIVGGDFAPAPTWLVDELVVVVKEISESSNPKFFPFQAGTPYGEAALRNALKELTEVADGGRNDALNKAAFGLAQLEAGGELSRDAALEGLLRVSNEIGLKSFEARNTIESGWTAGVLIPRQAPKATA